MFKSHPKLIADLVRQFIRLEGLETPLMQKRTVDAWDVVMGRTIARYSGDKFIRNQTLFVKILNPALRQDLSMMRAQIVRRLNEHVGAQVITDVKLF